jgi:anti-sigma regulatory factor (Ser/Thr protein kinase)
VRPEPAILLELQLDGASFETAGEASSRIKKILQQIGISADINRRIAIAAYEAEMNVIIHAKRGKMQAAIYPDHTQLTVEDEGPGIADIAMAMKEGYSTAPDYVREMGFGAGMGLPNMVRCSDDFKIESIVGQGTTITMIIYHQKRDS